MKSIRLLTLALVAAVSVSSATAATPNIVLILSDDYGWGSLGCYGADPKLIKTPALDRLAREGRRFTDANTTSSVCSPTRYSVMTGRYCWRTTLTHEVLGTFSPLHIETNRLTMASLLKAHGYRTAAIGKWHLGYGASDGSAKWRTDYAAELSPGPLDVGCARRSFACAHGKLRRQRMTTKCALEPVPIRRPPRRLTGLPGECERRRTV